MTQQPPPPPPGFGPPPPQYAPVPPPPAYAPAAPQQMPMPGPMVPVGPEFMAVDRRNAIVVDAEGVTLQLGDASADFPWPEIRSVHYRASPNGRSLLVGVIHLDGQFYEGEVEARPRARLAEWFPQLAWVLGHYRPMG